MSETAATTHTAVAGNPKRHNNAARFVQRFCFDNRKLPTIDEVVDGAKVTRPGAIQAIKVQAKVLGFDIPKHPKGRKAQLEGVDLPGQLAVLAAAFPACTVKQLTAALAGMHGCSSSLITARAAEQRKAAAPVAGMADSAAA